MGFPFVYFDTDCSYTGDAVSGVVHIYKQTEAHGCDRKRYHATD
jgi:hypothetical protein